MFVRRLLLAVESRVRRVRRLVHAVSLLVVFAAAMIPSGALHAQSIGAPPMSFDLAVGAAGLRGEARATTTIGGGEIVIAGRPVRRSRSALVLAGVGMVHVDALGDDAVCLLTPTGGCRTSVHLIPRAGLLIGGEMVRRNTAFRLLGGPLLYSARTAAPETGRQTRSRTAVYGRADITFPARSTVALTISANASQLGSVEGQRLSLAGASIGIRVQPGSGR